MEDGGFSPEEYFKLVEEIKIQKQKIMVQRIIIAILLVMIVLAFIFANMKESESSEIELGNAIIVEKE